MHPVKNLIAKYLFGETDSMEREDIEEAFQSDPNFKENYYQTLKEIRAFKLGESDTPIHEKISIEKELKGDSEAEGLVAIHENINKAMRYLPLRMYLDEVYEQYQREISLVRAKGIKGVVNKIIPRREANRWIAAASIVIVAGIAAFLIFGNDKGYSSDELFSQFYNAYRIDTYTTPSGTLLMALQKYKNRQFDEALCLLNDVPDRIEVVNEKMFYKGLLLMEQQRYKKAIVEFNLLLESEDSMLKSETYWYLALCNLKTGQVDDTRDLLKNIFPAIHISKKSMRRIFFPIHLPQVKNCLPHQINTWIVLSTSNSKKRPYLTRGGIHKLTKPPTPSAFPGFMRLPMSTPKITKILIISLVNAS